MKKWFFVIFSVVSLFCLSACNSQGNDLPEEAEPEYAYFEVFKSLFPEGFPDLTYCAVDFSQTKLSDPSIAKELIQKFCDNNNYTFLPYTVEALKEKGYINEFSFPNGCLISFNDMSLSGNTLVTRASLWNSADGSITNDFTVEKKNGSWEITKNENYSIS